MSEAKGKVSDMERLAPHKDKLITKVSFGGGDVKIDWKKAGQETKTDKKGKEKTVLKILCEGKDSWSEPSHEDFDIAMQELAPVVVNSLDLKAKIAGSVFVSEITLKHNLAKGITVSITGQVENGNGQHVSVKVPACPLYNPDNPKHRNGAVHTLTESETEIVEKIMLEAKLYMGGKRGAMQENMFNEDAA